MGSNPSNPSITLLQPFSYSKSVQNFPITTPSIVMFPIDNYSPTPQVIYLYYNGGAEIQIGYIANSNLNAIGCI